MSKNKLIAIRLSNYPNCELNDGDYFSELLVISNKRWKDTIKRIDILSSGKKKNNCLYEEEFTNGGHGCILSIESDLFTKHAKIKDITLEEFNILEKWAFASTEKECQWFKELSNHLDQIENAPKNKQQSKSTKYSSDNDSEY